MHGQACSGAHAQLPHFSLVGLFEAAVPCLQPAQQRLQGGARAQRLLQLALLRAQLGIQAATGGGRLGAQPLQLQELAPQRIAPALGQRVAQQLVQLQPEAARLLREAGLPLGPQVLLPAPAAGCAAPLP